jgi:serine protease Do
MYAQVAASLSVMLALTSAQICAQTVGDVFKRVNRAVVVIYTAERTIQQDDPTQLVSVGGVGSGFLISHNGEVMTAAHVVHAADRIVVEFESGERIPARVVASDPSADVALLKLDQRPTGAVPVGLGDSDLAEIGDEVFIIGAPLGVSHTLTVGHISARRTPNRTIGGMYRAEFLQTDAAINQGNSGGPMFNMNGEVIGIVSHIISQTGGFTGLGFVVTSNVAKDLLIDNPVPTLGIDGVWLSEALAAALNVPQKSGVLVQRVARGSLGEELGLRGGELSISIGDQNLIVGGDVILETLGVQMDGTIESFDRIRQTARGLRPGDPITVAVLRAGQRIELTGVYVPHF